MKKVFKTLLWALIPTAIVAGAFIYFIFGPGTATAYMTENSEPTEAQVSTEAPTELAVPGTEGPEVTTETIELNTVPSESVEITEAEETAAEQKQESNGSLLDPPNPGEDKPKPTENPDPTEIEPFPTEDDPDPTETVTPTQCHTHSYNSTIVAPTCVQKGYTKFTCSCGKSYNDNYTEKKPHSYTAATIAPSCVEQGYTVYTCQCGNSYTDNYVQPHDHNYSCKTVAPTTEAEGYTEHTCVNCGDSYKDNFVEKLKFVYDYALAQQIGNDYIASLGYVVDPSLPYGVCGYLPAAVYSGRDLLLIDTTQAWMNSEAVEAVQATINWLKATDNTEGESDGCRMFLAVTYDESSDTYTFCVYYG